MDTHEANGATQPTPDMFSLLRQIPFFSLFASDEHLQMMLDFGNWMECPSGTALINEGSVERYLLVLVQGRVKVLKGKKLMGEVVGPSVIGEIGAFMNEPRSATVITAGKATAFRINVQRFSKLPSDLLFKLMSHLFQLTAKRLVEADNRLARV
jgi:CRP-like cAMP-binding protein